MSSYLKRYREEAGLTQAQLSEILNVPREELIREMFSELDKSRTNIWPAFLFDEDTNAIIDKLHLNLAQQDLFGLMYIYGSDYLKNADMDQDTFREELKSIPYGFIERVGSIRFMNQVEGLYRVIRYVKTDFLMKILKLNPEAEFDVRKLSKNRICEFIDEGHRPLNYLDDDPETSEGLDFKVNMRKAKIFLPVLEKTGPVYITDGRWSNPIREDVPEEFLNSVLEMCRFRKDLWEEGYYEREYNISFIRSGLETVTDYKNTAGKGKKERWMLSVNGKGRELLKWLKE